MASQPITQSAPDSATREEWEAAYSIYQARLILRDADQSIGALYAATERYGFTKFRLEGSYGVNWRGKQICRAEHEAAYDALTDADQLHFRTFADPLDAACVALLSTPAPDLEAVKIKLDLLEQNIFSASEIGRPGPEIIADDIQRLTGIAA